jgi:polyhydroxybutyrate depolymerase
MAPLLAADFPAARPVSVLILQGDDDPLVPIGGGELGFHRGQTVSTDSVVRRWVQRDACGTPASEALPDLDPNDGCRVVRTTWTGPESEVLLYTIQGGGHSWPGGPQYLGKWIVGRVCRDLDATTLIWDFFSRHPRK